MIFRSTYRKPILIVGNGVREAGAASLLVEFVRKIHIPVLTTMNGVDLVQDDLKIGFIGTHGNRVANMILNHCDLIVSVGARLGLRQVGRFTKNFAPKADLIRVDIDEYELSRTIKEGEVKYHTDAKDFMRLVLAEENVDYSEWFKQCMKVKELLEDVDKQEGNRVVEKIASLLPANPNVSVDVGQHQCWCAQSLKFKGYEGRIHISGGYGTMGCGLPYAIGSSIAIGKKMVYCIAGDGGFQMNIQELETVRRERLPIKIFILNNKVLGKIYETQRADLDSRFAYTAFSGGYTVPDFMKIANAYGIKAVKLDSYEELSEYKAWIDDDEPCLFDIMLAENSMLTPKIKWETGMISPRIDDTIFDRVNDILGA